jgi:hypothetical protein
MTIARHFDGAALRDAMRFAFALLYALIGALLLYVDLTGAGAATMNTRLVLGLAALLCLFAAWQAAFGGGLAWRIVHAIFGVVVVGACLFLWGFGVLLLHDKSAGIPSIVAFIAAGILTLPALGYLASLLAWMRAEKRPDPESAQGAATAATATVPGHAGAAAVATAPGRTLARRHVGVALAFLLFIGVAAWARFGAEWRCSAADPQPCLRSAEAAVARGDLAKAVALYNRAIPAALTKQTSSSEQLPYAWHARNEILARMNDRPGLAKAIGEACPRLETSCEDLVKTLTKGNYPTLAEEAWQALCRSGSEDACGHYGVWLLEARGTEPAIVALQGYCTTGSKEACLRLGIELKKQGRADEAHAVLIRSCRLSMAEKRSGIPPRTALCQFAIRQERSAVSRQQWVDDIRSVCAEDLGECPGLTMDLDLATSTLVRAETCRAQPIAKRGDSFCRGLEGQ